MNAKKVSNKSSNQFTELLSKQPFVNTIYNPLKELNEKILEQSKQCQLIFKEIVDNEALQHIRSQFDAINGMYRREFEDINSLFSEIGEKWKNILYNLYTHYPTVTKELSQHGWFFELDTEKDFLADVYSDFKSNNVALAESKSVSYFENEADRIFKELSKRHNNRKAIISEIKQAFLHEYYHSAITCLLSQIDGISYDVTGKLIFTKDISTDINNEKKYLPKMVVEINKSADEYTKLFMAPILEQCPIYANDNYLKYSKSSFNRHKVLHGKDIEYGTKTNFLKCLSFFKYVSDLLSLIDTKKTI